MPSLTFFVDAAGELVSPAPADFQVESAKIERLQQSLRGERKQKAKRQVRPSRDCAECGSRGHVTADHDQPRAETGNSGRFCKWCADLSHRRAHPLCLGCGLPYQAERMAVEEPRLVSSAGLWSEE
jgi:hypothetical protein